MVLMGRLSLWTQDAAKVPWHTGFHGERRGKKRRQGGDKEQTEDDLQEGEIARQMGQLRHWTCGEVKSHLARRRVWGFVQILGGGGRGGGRGQRKRDEDEPERYLSIAGRDVGPMTHQPVCGPSPGMNVFSCVGFEAVLGLLCWCACLSREVDR